MSKNKDQRRLKLKGASRHHELASAITSWGIRGMSRSQCRTMAATFDEEVNSPPLDNDEFHELFKNAWAIVEAKSKEEYFKNLHEVEAKKPEFLLNPFIPRGALTMLDGHPGQGKSLITTHLCGAITTGGRFAGSYPLRRGRVLFLAPEDDADRVLRPRLEMHGADLKKIRFMAQLHCLDEYGRSLLRKEIIDYPPELVVIDPLPPFMAEDTNNYKATEVRAFMQPLALLAREMDIAIVLVRHLRKGGSAFAIEAGQGSMDFIATVRSGLIVFSHPADPTTKVLAHAKANWSAPGPSLTFEVKAGSGQPVPTINWLAQLDQTADELLQTSNTRRAEEIVADKIIELLTPGAMPARDIIDRLMRDGFSERTIDRAKLIAGVKSGRGPGAKWSLK